MVGGGSNQHRLVGDMWIIAQCVIHKTNNRAIPHGILNFAAQSYCSVVFRLDSEVSKYHGLFDDLKNHVERRIA